MLISSEEYASLCSMDIKQALMLIHSVLDTAQIRHKLIGAFALGANGVHRATNDIDFLVKAADAEKLKKILEEKGFRVFHQSDDVMQFKGPMRVDFILARRELSLAMVESAIGPTLVGVPSATAEELIGLKIQAYKNSPVRALQDKADIQALIRTNPKLDWKVVKRLADLFGEWQTVESIRITLESNVNE